MSTVSVIVPIYNGKKYIHRCIDSILSQSFNDFELIIVDDGSCDGSAEICDYYSKSDNRVKVIHKPNGGVSNARNAGLSIATGDYIVFCDGDDYIRSDLLEIALTTIIDKKADVVSFQLRRLSINDIKRGRDTTVSGIIDLNSGNRFNFLEQVATWQTGGWQACRSIFRRKIIADNDIQFCETCNNFAEDLGFTLEYLLYASRIVFIDEQLYFYDDTRETSMMNRSKTLCRINDVNELSYFLYDKVRTALPDEPFCRLHYFIISNQLVGFYLAESNKVISEWIKCLESISEKEYFKEQNMNYYLMFMQQNSSSWIKTKLKYYLSKKKIIDRYLGNLNKSKLKRDLVVYRLLTTFRHCTHRTTSH